MSGNPIRRVTTGEWVWPVGAPHARMERTWAAICPDCGDTIKWFRGWSDRSRTRKNAKDALHRHRVERHGRGLVGRSDARPLSVA